MSKLSPGTDGKLRCHWCTATDEYIDYHDNEWGFPVKDDFHLFEKLCLESFQSGLSWRTILSKRDNFRVAFKSFDFNVIAKFTQRDVDRLLKNEGIIRHRGKIEATINNARKTQDLIAEHGSLAVYIWSYQPEKSSLATPQTVSTSAESTVLSKDLKKRGFKFVGPTTVYAFMQAAGLVNDHAEGCITRKKVISACKKFILPETEKR